MKTFLTYSLLSISLLLIGCTQNHKSSVDSATIDKTVSEPIMVDNIPEWTKNVNMYEVNIRQFTPEGTFAAFETHIPRLKKMGVDILWLMPVYPISDTKKKGSLGSYYAISDYTKVNPEFGTLEEFRKMVKTVHASGMKIILDFVPNHTGWDHTWITEHPDFFTQDSKGNIVDPIDPKTGESWGWTDVADLNFENPDMRKAMIDDMLYWINDEAIDGYRMDVAHGVPVSFWDEVSTALTASKKDVFMLAESEVPELRNNGYFQTDYGWEFHHILNAIAKGEKGPKDIKEWYDHNQETYKKGWHIQFTSNHDENSWAGSTEERMGKAHDALAALAFTIDGMPLLYGGQEEPLTKRLEFFEKDDIGFGEYAKADWFAKFLTEKHQNKALWNGDFGGDVDFMTVDEQVLAYQRQKDGDIVYCILNLSDKPASFTASSDTSGLTDIFTGKSIQLKADQKVQLNAWEYKILTKS